MNNHYLLEYLPNLQTIKAVLAESGAIELNKLIFNDSSISALTSGGEFKQLVCSWKGSMLPDVIPCSLHVHYIHNEGVHARLKTKSHDQSCDWKSYTPTIKSVIRTLDITAYVGEKIIISCAFCKDIVFKESFKRCLPLPTSEWSEVIGDVFCHAHHLNKNPSHDLIPQDNDLLIGDDIVMFRGKPETQIVQITKDSNEIKCHRCCLKIGAFTTTATTGIADRDISIITLHRHKVYIEYFNPTTEQPCIVGQFNKQAFQNRMAALLLKTSIDYQCFHFTIKDIHTGRTVLQINCLRSITWLKANMSRTPLIHTSFTGISQTQSTQPIPILKLMFNLLMKCEDKLPNHQPHLISENIMLPREQCLLLAICLMDNHLSLPQSIRYAQNFKVGYLKLLWKQPHLEL